MALDVSSHRGKLIDHIIFRPWPLDTPPGTRLGLSSSHMFTLPNLGRGGTEVDEE